MQQPFDLPDDFDPDDPCCMTHMMMYQFKKHALDQQQRIGAEQDEVRDFISDRLDDAGLKVLELILDVITESPRPRSAASYFAGVVAGTRYERFVKAEMEAAKGAAIDNGIGEILGEDNGD